MLTWLECNKKNRLVECTLRGNPHGCPSINSCPFVITKGQELIKAG